MKETLPAPTLRGEVTCANSYGANLGQSRSKTQLPKLKPSVFMLKLTEGMLPQFPTL